MHSWSGDDAFQFDAELLASRTDGERTTDLYRTERGTYVIVGTYLDGKGWISVQTSALGVVRNLSNLDRATGDRFLTPHVRALLAGASVNDSTLKGAIDELTRT